MPIYDVFSKRAKALPDVYTYDNLPEPLRNQIAMILNDLFPYHETRPSGETSMRAAAADQTIEVIRRSFGLDLSWGVIDHEDEDLAGEGGIPAWEHLIKFITDVSTSPDCTLAVVDLLVTFRLKVDASRFKIFRRAKPGFRTADAGLKQTSCEAPGAQPRRPTGGRLARRAVGCAARFLGEPRPGGQQV